MEHTKKYNYFLLVITNTGHHPDNSLKLYTYKHSIYIMKYYLKSFTCKNRDISRSVEWDRNRSQLEISDNAVRRCDNKVAIGGEEAFDLTRSRVRLVGRRIHNPDRKISVIVLVCGLHIKYLGYHWIHGS